MPVIVPPAAFNLWLDCAAVDATTAAALFLPASDALLESYAVSNAVNRAANDSPELIVPAPASVDNGADAVAADAPADPEKADKQLSLF
jgi:putative SOS response-associated peptidase YedK